LQSFTLFDLAKECLSRVRVMLTRRYGWCEVAKGTLNPRYS